MMLRGLLTMSTGELERLAVVQKIVDKNLTQVLVAKRQWRQWGPRQDRIPSYIISKY
jgi:hypothetical protein